MMPGLQQRIILKNPDKVCRMKIVSLKKSVSTKFEVIGVKLIT